MKIAIQDQDAHSYHPIVIIITIRSVNSFIVFVFQTRVKICFVIWNYLACFPL